MEEENGGERGKKNGAAFVVHLMKSACTAASTAIDLECVCAILKTQSSDGFREIEGRVLSVRMRSAQAVVCFSKIE